MRPLRPILLILIFSLCAATFNLSDCSAQTVKEEIVSLYPVSGKGTFALKSNLVLPVFNWFYYTAEGYGERSSLGFGFFNLGVDYFYKDKNFVSLTGGEAYDLRLPATISYGFGGKDTEKIQVLYFSLSNNHTIGKFSLGYGLSYGYDRWKDRIYPEDVAESYDNYTISRIYFHSLGFVFPMHFYTNVGYYMGLTYRPMLLQFSDKTRFRYQHTLSVDLGFRICLRKKKSAYNAD